MRSFTAADLPGRCPVCWVIQAHCICGALGRVANRTEVVFVRHHYETYKSTNTARIASLVLQSSRTVEVGCDLKAADRELASLAGAWLLYPDAAPVRSIEQRPARLVVIDGTWQQSRRMLRKLTSLHELPRLSLGAAAIALPALREAPRSGARSTIAAVADALELLEGADAAEPLRRAARLHTEQVFLARGALHKL